MSQATPAHLLLPAPRLAGVLARHLGRRFGLSRIDGLSAAHWAGPAHWLPAVMALGAQGRPQALYGEQFRAYGEPCPFDLPCGAWLASDPDPQAWMWDLGKLFDEPRGLRDRAHQAWQELLAGHITRLSWDVIEPDELAAQG